jgi:hypothetical protein
MKMLDIVDSLGGLAARRELVSAGVDPGQIDLAAWYGWRLIRVRNGWFARPDEHPAVLRAWRIGGRLTCVSAVALHLGDAMPHVLHVEVAANTARLHDPVWPRLPLAADAPVVVHWSRHPGPGDRRAVGLEHAEWVVERCGVHAGGPRRRPQAASSESASRMV